MTALALALAEWADGFRPGPGDLELADRSLRDTVAVALAASGHPVTRLAAGLPDGARWAVAAHVLDFDDLHMESTTHISALCVPAALATGGGARAYLAAAGVMARLGTALGWPHYSAGWHATCTAGAPACAAGAAVALGLAPGQIATAIALAIPGPAGCSGRSAPTPSRCRPGSRSTPGSGRRCWPPRARRPTGRRWRRGWPWSAAIRAGWTWPAAWPARRSPAGWPSRSTRAATRCSARSARSPNWQATGWTRGRCAASWCAPPRRPWPRSSITGRTPGCRASSASNTRAPPRCSTRIRGSPASPTRRSAGRRPAAWPAWWKPSSPRAGPGCSTVSWRPRCTPVATCCGSSSSSLRERRAARPRAAELQAKLGDCVAGLGAAPSSWTWQNAAQVLARYLPADGRR